MVANWNSTIRAASGKYIKFLFQDDLLHPNCLEEMVRVAECDERIGFVFSLRELLIEPGSLVRSPNGSCDITISPRYLASLRLANLDQCF
jgi:hypothetical protein